MKKIIFLFTLLFLFTGCQTQSSNNNINIQLDEKLINKLKGKEGEKTPVKEETPAPEKITESPKPKGWSDDQKKQYVLKCSNIVMTTYPFLASLPETVEGYCQCGLRELSDLQEKYTPEEIYSDKITISDTKVIQTADQKCTLENISSL